MNAITPVPRDNNEPINICGAIVLPKNNKTVLNTVNTKLVTTIDFPTATLRVASKSFKDLTNSPKKPNIPKKNTLSPFQTLSSIPSSGGATGPDCPKGVLNGFETVLSPSRKEPIRPPIALSWRPPNRPLAPPAGPEKDPTSESPSSQGKPSMPGSDSGGLKLTSLSKRALSLSSFLTLESMLFMPTPLI